VFGMHSSSQDFQEEFFDAEDAEAAAAWDLDELEVERLRAVASSQQQQLSSGVSGLLGLGGATPGVEGPPGERRTVCIGRCIRYSTASSTTSSHQGCVGCG
jgi:hypothetical protein